MHRLSQSGTICTIVRYERKREDSIVDYFVRRLDLRHRSTFNQVQVHCLRLQVTHPRYYIAG